MPSTPTSKSQVQAYRFVIRRMQSALVRKDAVMLHDPMRTHSRATIVGAILAVIGLAGFLVYGLLKPANPKPDQGILISAQSGRVYVYTAKPPTLTPTFNVVSARLLYAAFQSKGSGGTAGGSANQSAVEPQTVDDTALDGMDVPIHRLTGIPDGPDVIPVEESQRATGKWAICDHDNRNAKLNNPTLRGEITTTALAGLHTLGTRLQRGRALLVKAPDQQAYLIYRTPKRVNEDPDNSLSGDAAVRAKIDLTNNALMKAYHMSDATPRPISLGLLNAIPEVPQLAMPHIPGERAQDSFGLGLQVGDVFRVANSDGSQTHYLLLRDGIEPISSAVAEMVRHAVATNAAGIPQVAPADISDIPVVHPYDFSTFPEHVPEVLAANSYPTVCLGWSVDNSDPAFPREHTVVTVGKKLPLPNDKARPVKIGSPNPDGAKIDQFWMPPSKAAVVRSASGPGTFQRGQIFVVSSRGVKYGVPNERTARIIGLTNPVPAPKSILGLLPSGVELDMQHAQKTYDSLRGLDRVGSYPSGGGQAGGSPGGIGAQAGN